MEKKIQQTTAQQAEIYFFTRLSKFERCLVEVYVVEKTDTELQCQNDLAQRASEISFKGASAIAFQFQEIIF